MLILYILLSLNTIFQNSEKYYSLTFDSEKYTESKESLVITKHILGFEKCSETKHSNHKEFRKQKLKKRNIESHSVETGDFVPVASATFLSLFSKIKYILFRNLDFYLRAPPAFYSV